MRVRFVCERRYVATVFISHKQQDSALAKAVSDRLKFHGIGTYLDVLDHALRGSGEQLTEHLRSRLAQCDHLMAVLSPATKTSWWVPFEIGLATERAYPISTYSEAGVSLPDYLERWPYLKSLLDLDKYASVLANAKRRVLLSKSFDSVTATTKRQYATTVESELRAALGQRR